MYKKIIFLFGSISSLFAMEADNAFKSRVPSLATITSLAVLKHSYEKDRDESDNEDKDEEESFPSPLDPSSRTTVRAFALMYKKFYEECMEFFEKEDPSWLHSARKNFVQTGWKAWNSLPEFQERLGHQRIIWDSKSPQHFPLLVGLDLKSAVLHAILTVLKPYYGDDEVVSSDFVTKKTVTLSPNASLEEKNIYKAFEVLFQLFESNNFNSLNDTENAELRKAIQAFRLMYINFHTECLEIYEEVDGLWSSSFWECLRENKCSINLDKYSFKQKFEEAVRNTWDQLKEDGRQFISSTDKELYNRGKKLFEAFQKLKKEKDKFQHHFILHVKIDRMRNYLKGFSDFKHEPMLPHFSYTGCNSFEVTSENKEMLLTKLRRHIIQTEPIIDLNNFELFQISLNDYSLAELELAHGRLERDAATTQGELSNNVRKRMEIEIEKKIEEARIKKIFLGCVTSITAAFGTVMGVIYYIKTKINNETKEISKKDECEEFEDGEEFIINIPGPVVLQIN